MKIAFEGIDLCGKTTQITLLKTELEECEVIKFPTEKTALLKHHIEGKRIVDGKASFFLFLYDIFEHTKALEEKKHYLFDRYVFSTIAYGYSFSYETAKKIVELSSPLIPDVVFLLNISPEESRKRRREEKTAYDKNEKLQQQAYERFLKMAEENFLTKWVVVDATKRPLEIHREIMQHLKECKKP